MIPNHSSERNYLYLLHLNSSVILRINPEPIPFMNSFFGRCAPKSGPALSKCIPVVSTYLQSASNDILASDLDFLLEPNFETTEPEKVLQLAPSIQALTSRT